MVGGGWRLSSSRGAGALPCVPGTISLRCIPQAEARALLLPGAQLRAGAAGEPPVPAPLCSPVPSPWCRDVQGAPFGWKRGSVSSGCVVTWAVCKGARRAKGEMETGLGTAGRGWRAALGAALAGCRAAEPLRRAGLGDAAPRLAADGGPCPAPPSLDPSSQGDEGGFIQFASRCCSEALPQERSALPRSPRRQRAPRRHGVRPCPQPRPGASSQGAGQRGGF